MIYTQREIYEYLCANPLGVIVPIGDVGALNGRDYIFLDYTSENAIPSDNKGDYQTYLQITVATHNFDDRRTLTEYVKQYLPVSITFEKSLEFEYFVARCTCGVLMHPDEPISV